MLSEKKQELQVAALENGTVIDHIPSERLFTVVSLLGLEHMSNNITIGFNLKSKKLGTKGIIKIADKFFCDEEINRIAVVAPNVKLNIIRDYEVVEKREVRLPEELRGIVSFLESPLGEHYLDGTWRMEAYTGTNMEETEELLVKEAVEIYQKR